MEKPCAVWKIIQIFQAHLHMTSAGIWPHPWLFHMYNKEVWMAWYPACSWKKKDVSWNSAFSRWASTESREKIYRNRTKEKISITHGQFPNKDRKGQCPKINWTVPIMWYQYLLGTFNASLPWLLTKKFYFIFHIHCA